MSDARAPRRPDTIFWVDPGAVQGDRLSLDADESHHLLRVHRAGIGAPFVAVDGAGVAYECEVHSAERGIAVGRIGRRTMEMGEPPVPITLLVGLPDAGPTEVIVEHGVALGATAFDFFAAGRSGRPALAAARLNRLGRVARSALKQSLRSRMPELRSSPDVETALRRLHGGLRYLADPAGSRLTPPPPGQPQGSVTLAVGPPGGLEDREVDRFVAAGFSRISLVSNRLATETAAIALLSMARNVLF